MSKLYRSVWNEALGAWVAIAEIEGSCGTYAQCQQFDFKSSKPNFALSHIMQATTLGLLASSANNALAQHTILNVSPMRIPVTIFSPIVSSSRELETFLSADLVSATERSNVGSVFGEPYLKLKP